MLRISNARLAVTCVALILGITQAASAQAAPGQAAPNEVLIGDASSQPESLTMAPGGVLIVGSSSSPYVYKVRPGSSTAEKFIDASAEGPGTFFYGMMADAATRTLWTCEVTPVPDTTPVRKHSALRSFDLSTGAPKIRWSLPGDNVSCNDLSIGPDKALYFTDTPTGRIYKLAAGGSTPELYQDLPVLIGIDGITFLNGALFVNNVITSKIFRIPVDAAGKPGAPVEITADQPVRRPDGMRAANGKILVAGNNKILALTVDGDKATVTVLKEGLRGPTAVEPAGDTIWITERSAGVVEPIPMPK